jgi:hypothetical protein
MSRNPDDKRQWEDLNALVDGELDRARVADVAAWIAQDADAARAFASVAALSATTAGLASEGRRRPFGRSWWTRGIALLALGIAMGAFLAYVALPERNAPEAQLAALAPQSLGLADDVTIGGIRLPNLQRGGLRLERVGVVQDGARPQLEAAYVGERGCRVRLVVAPAANAIPAEPALQAMQWTVGGFVYTMTSERMDPQRFVAVAAIAQAETATAGATQLAGIPSGTRNRPCLG